MSQIEAMSEAATSIDIEVLDEPTGRSGIRTWTELVARPAGIFLASRAVVVTAMWMASRIPPPDSLAHIVSSWDGAWYLDTASKGYPNFLPMVDGHVAQ